ncbi:MAG: ergothioneine biosynthesis protein EgtC [Gammaproteobacteria bacterium]
MCRLAAYLGPSIPLKQFLLDPEFSLMTQSWQPREMNYAKLNADGYGFGWFASDGRPVVYTQAMPIWTDANLPHLARALQSGLWFGHVRSATPGSAVNQVNAQPFCDQEVLFAHNGFIADFAQTLRPKIRQFLHPHVDAEIRGSTDSEHLFALLRHFLADDADLSIEDALSAVFELLDDWQNGTPLLLNCIVSDGERVFAARHAINHDCPTLYYVTDDDAFPGAQVVASERLTHSEFWQPVPEHHILILDPEAPAELLAL